RSRPASTIARRATDGRGHRPRVGDPGPTDPHVRRLRAVGNGCVHGPGPEPPEERVQRAAEGGPDRHPCRHHASDDPRREGPAHRIVVKAKLERHLSSKPNKPPARVNGKRVRAVAKKALATGLQGESNSIVPTVFWGVVVLIVGCLWWWAFRRWRLPLTWVLG